MLTACKRIKQIPQWKARLSISFLLSTPFCRNCNRSRGQLYTKKIRGFNKLPNGYVSTSHSLQNSRNYAQTHYITSIPVGVLWIWPFFAILSDTINNYQKSLTTQASSFEVEVADEFLNQILSSIENDPSCTKEICTTYVDKLCRAKNITAAAKLLQFLRDRRIFLTSYTYNLLLEAACEESDIEFSLQLFKDFLFSFEPISSNSYLNLAKAFANTNDSVLLLRFVREVSEMTFPRSATIVNRIIFALAEIRQVDKALLIFDHMKSLKCKPDLISYNTVLGILGRSIRVDEMLQEFASMKESYVNPDIVSYNTVLNALRKVGRLDLCVVFVKEMGERGVEPDLRTYTALIESFGKSGNIEESLRLFDEMKKKQIRPSIYVYRSLINNLKDSGRLDLAMAFTKEMNACLQDLVGPKDFKRKKR